MLLQPAPGVDQELPRPPTPPNPARRLVTLSSQQSVVIDKNVEIIGAGKPGQVVIQWDVAHENVLSLQAPTIRLAHIKIKHSGQNAQGKSAPPSLSTSPSCSVTFFLQTMLGPYRAAPSLPPSYCCPLRFCPVCCCRHVVHRKLARRAQHCVARRRQLGGGSNGRGEHRRL